MDTYEIELEPAEPEGFIAIVLAVPGLIVLGRSVDEVLERARSAIAYHVGRPGAAPCARQITVRRRGADQRYVA
jgi:predicted RNase H-like HicB family nuclease